MPETGNRDYLTGSYNRKWLFEDCPVCSQSGQFSVIYIDVGNFMPVNLHESLLRERGECHTGKRKDNIPELRSLIPVISFLFSYLGKIPY